MIDNNEYSQLTDFMHGEFQKIFMTYGNKQLPPKYLNSLTNSMLARYKVINNLEKKKLKFQIKVDYALFTMPHNWLWKMFHSRVWYHVKKRLSEQQKEEVPEEEVPEETSQITVPEVVRPVDTDAMNYPSTVNDNKFSF